MPDLNIGNGTLTAGQVSAGLLSGGLAVTDFVLPNGGTPTAPSGGNSAIFSDTGPGVGFPAWLSERGAARRLQTALHGKTWSSITASGGVTVNSAGAGTASPTGTVATSTFSANGWFQNVASAATASAQSLMRTSGIYRRGATGDIYAGVMTIARFYLPDANYDSAGASTGSRVQVGISQAPATSLGADRGAATTSAAIFVRAHVNGGATDTNWQFVTSDGAASTVADTGLAFAAQHVYETEVFVPAGGTSAYWRIRDVTAGTAAAGTSAANMPSATASLCVYVGVGTVDATVRNFSFRNIYAEADKG